VASLQKKDPPVAEVVPAERQLEQSEQKVAA
jgi:hypothetical protein